MNKPFRVLIAAVLFVSLSGLAQAQEGKDLDAFLADDSPALLFGLSQLSLQNWDGGIGIMCSADEDFHWRLAFFPRFGDTGGEFTDSLGTSDGSSTGSYGLGLSVAPFWVLSKQGDFFVSGGVRAYIGYSRSHNESPWRGSNWYQEATRTYLSASVGGNFGVAWVITPSVALHGEYLLGLGYQSESGNEKRGPDINLLQEMDYSSYSLHLSYGASLSLMVRL